MIANQISDLLVQGIGTTLIDSLWQGLLIALLLRLILFIIPGKNVELKYWISVTALCAMVFWGAYTFNNEVSMIRDTRSLAQTEYFQGPFTGVELQSASLKSLPSIRNLTDQLYAGLRPYMSTLVVVWTMGVIFFLLRLQGSMIYLKRLKSTGTRHVPQGWQDKIDHLTSKLSIRSNVKLLESRIADIPMVIGHLKPVILLPIGMLTGLSAREIEAILVHELAHVKRFDYLINIVQTVVESLLFFNPAVWWISKAIRKHREHCCDDIAVKYCGDQLEYAHALSNLGAWSHKTPALGMGLFKSRNELLMRIKRIVYPQGGSQTIKEKLVPGMVLLLAVLCLSWYSHKVQAQLIQVNSPASDPEHNHIQSQDTVPSVTPVDEVPTVPQVDEAYPVQPVEGVPSVEQVEDLPSMVPAEPLPPMEPMEDIEHEIEIDEEVELDPEVEIEIPGLDLVLDLDLEELAELSQTMADIVVEVSPDIEVEVEELIELESFNEVVSDIQTHFDDSTRKRIRQALEAQREALERAREQQAEALEKAREQLRESLEAGRPDELTDEEWEIARENIRRAERSLERALEQSERQLEQSERELEQSEHELERVWREHEHELHRHLNEIERERDVRIHRELEGIHRDRRADEHHRHIEDEARLRRTLVKDGLIDSYDSDISLSFKKDQVTINGVKLQGEVKDKYRRLLNEMYGENSTGSLTYKN